MTMRSSRQSSIWIVAALVLGAVFLGIAIFSQLGGGDDGSGEGNVPGATATPDIPANAVAISWVGYLLVFGIVIWAAARMLQEWEKRKRG